MHKLLGILLILIPFDAFCTMPVIDASSIAVEIQNGAKSAVMITNQGKSLTNEVSMIMNEVNMIKNQETMLKGIAKDGIHISDINDNLNQLNNISSSGLAITYATSDIKNKFDQQFGNKTPTDNYSKHNQTMMQSVLDSSRNTIQAAQSQMNYTQSETEGLKQITTASNSADGLKATIQGTNQLLDANASQMQNIASMQAQQNSLLAAQIAADASKEQAADQEDESFLGNAPTYKPYEGDSDLKEIPNFS